MKVLTPRGQDFEFYITRNFILMIIEEKRYLYKTTLMMRNSWTFEKLAAVPTAEFSKLEPMSHANWTRVCS